MQEVTFNLQTITPLFLAGADQAAAELRAPSFRGVMRYWQRALVGGWVGTNQKGLEKVAKTETGVFGATDTGSAISIKVAAASGEPKEFTEQISERVGGKWQATGKGYLLWSMARSGRADKGNLKPARWYFTSGTRFDVTLSARDQDDAKLKQAIAAFWLLVHLGGIGSRSRRCAGSLKADNIQAYTVQALKEQLEQGKAITLQDAEGKASKLSFKKSETANALKTQLEEGIRAARLLYNIGQPTAQNNAQFDVLAPGACRIWILQDEQPWSTAEIAMQRLGEKLQDYRSHIAIGRRKIFGLPLPPIVFNQRRASPLLLRVAELQGNRYVGIAVLFITAGRGVVMQDYKLIENWVNEFRGKVEVTL